MQIYKRLHNNTNVCCFLFPLNVRAWYPVAPIVLGEGRNRLEMGLDALFGRIFILADDTVEHLTVFFTDNFDVNGTGAEVPVVFQYVRRDGQQQRCQDWVVGGASCMDWMSSSVRSQAQRRMASRTWARLTERSAESFLSAGRWSPGSSLPASIRERICWATSLSSETWTFDSGILFR